MPGARSDEGVAMLRDGPAFWRRWRSRRVIVRDESMAPALAPGDRLLIDPRAYRNRPPRVGEVVVFGDPAEPGRWLVKRVAGVGPGRFWRTREGFRPSDGASASGTPPEDALEEVVLPDGDLFVTGDARERARDSRDFGPVPLASVVGRAYQCYAPPDRRRAL